MLSYKRSTRVAELIQQELSRIVQELKEPGLGFVTITGVKLSDDLQQARVFYSVLGNPEDVARSNAILEDSLPFIRQQLAGRLNLRRTPALTLEYDTTPQKANRIFELLERIRAEKERAERPVKKATVPKKTGPGRKKSAK